MMRQKLNKNTQTQQKSWFLKHIKGTQIPKSNDTKERKGMSL